MAAAMAMDREPEVARFIDSYKFDQDMATRRDRYGGGTSLPLNSDGYEEKQQHLRDERHKEWLVQQDKQRQVEQQKYEARRRSPPRPAQPPGPQMDYNLANEQARAEEKRAYQDYMKAKEERYWAMRGRPVTPPGGLDIGNYDRQVKETAQQKKKEYKEMLDQQQREHMYLRARQEPEMAVLDRNAAPSQYLANKPPPGPNYGRGRDEAFKTESQNPRYGQPVYPEAGQSETGRHKFNQEVMERQRPPFSHPPKSPEKPANPEWLKVPLRDDERQSELGTPMAFKTDTYSRQQPPAPEQAYSHQPPNAPEQSYAHQLPPASEQGPFSRDGQKPYEKFERYQNDVEGLFGRPQQSSDRPRSKRSLDAERRHSPSKKEDAMMPNNQLSPRRMKNVLYTDSEEVSSKRRQASKERQKEYNEFLKIKTDERRRHDEFRQQQQMGKPAEVVKNPYYSSDDYEKFQREIQRKQGEEYKDFLAKKSTEVHNRGWNFEQNGVLELRGDDTVQTRQRELRAERQKDYNNYISQQKYTNPGRKHEFVDTASGPYGGLFQGLGEHGNRSDVLNKERQNEYNEKLDQKFGKDRPSGRPNWVKEPLPNSVDRGRSPMKTQPPADQYQQMLDEKRREEASRRRYEDPEYQDRLAQGRDRGEAGARYGY